ncbi:MAG: glycine cleavage system protein GcvH [Candidatus Lokiarchaeota archaeon]|nr:glycine cleavage system protein GcvH [Candidatus Lokiarchaeota archaeon]
MNIPEGLFYTDKHQYVKKEGDITIVGITDFAQNQLGDIITCDLNAGDMVGASFSAGDLFEDISIEAQKAVADIFAPISGQITEVNEALEDEPEKINEDPYGVGWIVKIKPSNFDKDKTNLMDAAAYAASLK